VITSELALRKGAKGLEIKTTFVNTCEDHRLRIMFPTYLNATHSSAEEPFDVVERPIDRGSDSPWRNTWNPTHPHQRFVDVSDGKTGLAIINDGLREYEVTDDATRTIGITLLRAFEVALTTVAWRWERHPEMKLSQALDEHLFRYFIYPHAGDWDEGKVMQQAEFFNVPLEMAQAAPHDGDLAKAMSFFELSPDDLVLSCIKMAEDGDGIIVRVFNPTNREIQGTITCFQKPAQMRYTNLNEEPIDSRKPDLIDDKIVFNIEAKKIVTLELIDAK
jgi:mannosylglycerate hydrolase